MKYLLILSLLVTGCARDILQGSGEFSNVNPVIKVYFDRFEQETHVSSTGITAGFSDLDSGIAGQCIIYGPYREILIDNAYWEDLEDYDDLKEQLIYHELGHCALGLGHIPDMYGDIPLSIMNPVAFNEDEQLDTYKARHEDYLKALVENKPINY